MKTALRFFLFSFLLTVLACSQKKNNKTADSPLPKNDSTPRTSAEAPYNPYTSIDLSPMDMAYFPVDYPKLKMTKVMAGPPLARIIYSRPHLGGRQLFENILKYDEPWRLGANEATELELFKDAVIQGKKIPAGRYVLYCIPHKEKWTLVFNSNIDSWGLHPNAAKDVARFDIASTITTNQVEHFTMLFEKNGQQADLLMAWDNVEARLSFQF